MAEPFTFEEAIEPFTFEEAAPKPFSFEEATEAQTATVAQMAAATRHTLGVVGRAIAATDVALENRPEQEVEVAQPTDQWGRPPDPRGRNPAQLNPAWEGTRLSSVTGSEMLMRPLVEIPGIDFGILGPSQANVSTGTKVAAGAYNAAKTVPEFFTSLLGVSTLTAGGLPALVQRLVAGGFAVDLASHTPEQVVALAKAVESGDAQEISHTATSLGINVALAGLTAKHALRSSAPGAVVARALSEQVKATELADPNLAALKQVAPLTAEAVAKTTPIEAKPAEPFIAPVELKESDTPLTTAAVESVKEPAKPTLPEPPVAKPEGERALTTEGEPNLTGIKNAKVDEERASRGQEPILGPERLSDQIVWDATMARIEREPGWQDRLVEELKESPRSATSEEVLALDHRYVELKNEYAKATHDGEQHRKSGDAIGVEEATTRASFYESKLNELEQVVRKIGTEAGRAFRMRQRLLKEDFTLAAMEARARAAKGFEPLTEAEHAEIAELHAKLAEAERKATETESATNEKLAMLEAQRAMAEAKAASVPEYPPSVLTHAQRFVDFMHTKGDAARARIRERMSRTSAAVDPTVLADAAIIGAEHLSAKALDVAKFTEAMVRDVGEWVREHAQEIFDASKKALSDSENSFFKGANETTKKRVKKAAQATTPADARTEATNGLKESVAEGADGADIGRYARAIAETFIKDGIKDLEPLTDAVHGVLKEVLPEITRTESRDAWTQYGKYKPLNPDPVKVRLRELSTEGQKVSTIERLEKGLAGLKTGSERQPPTDKARRLQKEINELKKKLGIVTTDPATQLRSALDAIKTRNKNRIADLRFENSTRTRIVKNKRVTITDSEVVAQRAEIEALKKQNEEIFGGKELTDEQRLARAISASERAETAANERLSRAEKGDFSKPAGRPLPESAALNEIRARTAALREETKHLKDLATPRKTPDELAISALKSRLAREKADLTERLAKGDFSPRRKAPRELALDPTTAAAKAEVTLLKEEFNRRLEKHKYELKSRAAKIWLGAREALNLSRAILTSWDVSAVFRQGGFVGFGNPVRTARALGPMFSALRSDKRAAAIDEQIKARPNAKLYAQSKLFLAPREGKLSGMEEAFMSRLASKIPGIAASQRAYITFLNKLRADTFDALHESLVSKRTATPEELSAIANYINVATGRGDLGKAAAAGETLATVFFSPRLVASRFQLIAGQPLYRGSAATRFLVAKEYSKFLLGLSAMYSLGYLAGATIETNPTSSDFGKLKFGNTRVDPLGGLAQTTVLVSRLATGEKTNAKGVTEPIRGKVPFGKDTSADVIAYFLRTKLSPVVGSSVDVLTGQNVVGEPVTPGSVAVNAMVPLAFRDIYDVMLEQGIPAGTAIGILSLFGMGVQNYDANAKRPKP